MTKKSTALRRVYTTIQSSNGKTLKLKVTACCPQICIAGCSLLNHGPLCNAGSMGRIRWERVGVLGCTVHAAMHSAGSGHGTSPSVCRDRFCPETWKKKSEKTLSHQMTPGQPARVVNTCGNRSADTTEFCLPANIPESSGFTHSVIYLTIANSKLI